MDHLGLTKHIISVQEYGQLDFCTVDKQFVEPHSSIIRNRSDQEQVDDFNDFQYYLGGFR